MIVDDDSDLTLFYRISLEYYGFVVDTFNEPKEALSSFKPNYYDLVILTHESMLEGFSITLKASKKPSNSLP